MPKPKIMIKCFMCNNEFQYGANQYDGKHIKRYNITVCNSCYSGNWDGWNPDYEKQLIAHLEKEGIPSPNKNEKGWLPRE